MDIIYILDSIPHTTKGIILDVFQEEIHLIEYSSRKLEIPKILILNITKTTLDKGMKKL